MKNQEFHMNSLIIDADILTYPLQTCYRHRNLRCLELWVNSMGHQIPDHGSGATNCYNAQTPSPYNILVTKHPLYYVFCNWCLEYRAQDPKGWFKWKKLHGFMGTVGVEILCNKQSTGRTPWVRQHVWREMDSQRVGPVLFLLLHSRHHRFLHL